VQREYDASMCGTQCALSLLQLLVSIISTLARLPPSVCRPGILALLSDNNGTARLVSHLTALRFAGCTFLRFQINEVTESVNVTLL
jgi:hypothetical protein